MNNINSGIGMEGRETWGRVIGLLTEFVTNNMMQMGSILS